jgi:hypothetical protein
VITLCIFHCIIIVKISAVGAHLAHEAAVLVGRKDVSVLSDGRLQNKNKKILNI